MSGKRTNKKSSAKTIDAAPPHPKLSSSAAGALTDRQLGIIAAIGLAFGIGALYEFGPLNGMPSVTKWGWPWQDLGILPMSLAMLAPFVLITIVVWTSGQVTNHFHFTLAFTALVIAHFCLQLFSVMADPRGLQRIAQIVASADATAYFTDATRIRNLPEWLSHFHELNLTGHAKFHPAGPVVYYYGFLKLFGPDAGAFLGGCAVGLLASLGCVAMYHFAGLWTSDRKTRLVASAFYTLIPGLTAFFPEFDQIYPILSMLIVLTFVKSLEEPASWYRYAAPCGALIFIATFSAYNLLTIGAFPALYSAFWLWTRRTERTTGIVVLRTSAAALATTVSLYLLLWITTGYNAPAAFRHSVQGMQGGNEALGRPYWISIFTDMYDFALGAGIIAVPILFFHLRRPRQNRTGTAMTWIGLATILTVDLSGLLRGETARTWLFLQPFLVVPVALELGRLEWRRKTALLLLQWWILVCIKTKMSFIEP